MRQADIPVRDPVQSVCDMPGYDPMYLACEGRVNRSGMHVLLTTGLGGQRIPEELEDDPLPRIC